MHRAGAGPLARIAARGQVQEKSTLAGAPYADQRRDSVRPRRVPLTRPGAHGPAPRPGPRPSDPGDRRSARRITDVAGVEVGQTTLVRGSGRLVVGQGPVRTGVTVIHPRGRGNPDPVFGAWF